MKTPQIDAPAGSSPLGLRPTPQDPGPRLSICSCGHTGNNRTSDHASRFAPGHGACKVPGCTCAQFTWVGWAK